jgi:hypothetical protein
MPRNVTEEDRERAIKAAKVIVSGCADLDMTDLLTERVAIGLLLARADQSDLVAEVYERTGNHTDAKLWRSHAMQLRGLAAGQ